MRVVIDTNILISALISPQGLSNELYQHWLARKFQLITSTWQLEEIRRVSRYPSVKDNFQPHEVGKLINGLRKHAFVVEALPRVTYSPDPDDNPIIAAALAANADYIISGDKKDIQSLQRVAGIKIVTTREFIEDIL
ncbi:MAG: putative toxin-antitoxin system toxin component, PIN family [Deinococcota bacterium]